MRASLNQRFKNALEHRFGPLQHFIVPKPNHAKAVACEPSCAFEVFQQMIGMLAPIELDDQSRSHANEIHDERTDRHLTPKSVPAHSAIAQVVPETPFGIR